jgi:hypothetical protein
VARALEHQASGLAVFATVVDDQDRSHGASFGQANLRFGREGPSQAGPFWEDRRRAALVSAGLIPGWP